MMIALAGGARGTGVLGGALPLLSAALAELLQPEPLPAGGDREAADPVEAALIERARQGDRQAFDRLFRAHADDTYRRLTRLVGPDPEREDLLQEVFLAAYRGLPRFRGAASLSTWLYRITAHVACSHLRRRRRRPLELDQLDERELPAEPRALSPEARATQQQQLVAAFALLARLKPKKRIAFVLRVVDDLSLQEIAEIVDATPAAVGQRIKHAQRELSDFVARQQRRQQPQEVA